MIQLIRTFIIMREASVKMNRDPKTTIAINVANAELSKSKFILSTLQRANVIERAASCDLF